MTLAKFQEQLQRMVASPSRGISTPQLNMWINLAYREILGAIEFEPQRTSTTFDTVDGTIAYDEPSDQTQIILVKDTENDNVLQFVETPAFRRRDPDTEGEPQYWTRIGSQIHLHPTPDDAYSMLVEYLAMPADMSDPTDTPVFGSQWDSALLQLAFANALQEFREFDGAQMAYSRALAALRSRKHDRAHREATPQIGLQVAYSEEDLRSE